MRKARSVTGFVVLTIFARYPTALERSDFNPSAGVRVFDQRQLPADQEVQASTRLGRARCQVSTWTNHLVPEANHIQNEWQIRLLRRTCR